MARRGNDGQSRRIGKGFRCQRFPRLVASSLSASSIGAASAILARKRGRRLLPGVGAFGAEWQQPLPFRCPLQRCRTSRRDRPRPAEPLPPSLTLTAASVVSTSAVNRFDGARLVGGRRFGCRCFVVRRHRPASCRRHRQRGSRWVACRRCRDGARSRRRRPVRRRQTFGAAQAAILDWMTLSDSRRPGLTANLSAGTSPRKSAVSSGSLPAHRDVRNWSSTVSSIASSSPVSPPSPAGSVTGSASGSPVSPFSRAPSDRPRDRDRAVNRQRG